MSTLHETQLANQKTELGFWLYLMTDLMLFASLFAAFMVLRVGTNGGSSGVDIFNPQYALLETFVLLASSLSCGIALISARFGKLKPAVIYLVITMLLGASFLFLEIREFALLVLEGNSAASSAFLSAFFTLVATHGLHILIGLVWAGALLYSITKKGLQPRVLHKFGLFALFWHFLDIVWIFIFSVVYLIGGLS